MTEVMANKVSFEKMIESDKNQVTYICCLAIKFFHSESVSHTGRFCLTSVLRDKCNSYISKKSVTFTDVLMITTYHCMLFEGLYHGKIHKYFYSFIDPMYDEGLLHLKESHSKNRNTI